MDKKRFEKALALRDSGRLDEAITEFRSLSAKADDKNEKASLMLNEMRCYSSLGQLTNAEHILGQIRSLAPDDAVVNVNVDFGAACLSAQRGEFKKAIVEYEQILREYVPLLARPEYRNLYEDTQQRRGIALVNLGKYAEALPVLEEATSFTTLGTEGEQETRLYLGISYNGLHEEGRAKKEFLRVIALNVKNSVEAQAHYRVGILYFTEGAFAQAKQQLEMILQTYQGDIPNLPLKYVYEQLSRACHYLGEERNAKEYIKRSKQSSSPMV
jgi:tetratricopeptide (TPR) repeat protein